MSFFSSWRKNGESKPKSSKSKAWKIFKALLVAGVCLGLTAVLAFTIFAAYVSRDLPDPNTLSTREIPQSTKIYDRTGKTLLYEIHGDEQRTLVKIEDISDYVKQATISVEDRMFYQHHGIYWFGLMRAVVVNTLKGKRISGTSTLTQQLVKNIFFDNSRSSLRKVKEFILSLQIERQYTKDQILQMYLNEIPYGSTIYGVESAAQNYFGKPSKDLTMDEAALLAAIPQSPDYYNPYGSGTRGDYRSALIARQHLILDMMAEQGYVTKDQAEDAKKIDTLKKLKPRTIGNILAPHFVMYVKRLLEDKYGQKAVEQGGYKVITTLDWDKQQMAEDEVKKGVEANGKKYKFGNAAMVSLDPKTGQVLAMVGSKDFFDPTIDGEVNVMTRPRQPGSSFKPIIYAAGFIRGYLPETHLWDVETDFKTDGPYYHPHNYDFRERGPISARMALQGSLNIPAVKMLYLVGIGRALDFAETMGYTTFTNRSRFGLSFALGGGEVEGLEHANAFATFAREGQFMPTSAVLSVTGVQGNVVEEWKQPEGQRVMEPQISRLVSNVLSDNQARAYVFGSQNSLTLPDRPVAAKTGTTNNNKDAWTAGYTPNLVTVVWVGNSNGDEMAKGADGSIIAAPIWNKFMRRATKGLPVEQFVKPDPPSTTKLAILGLVTKQKLRVDRISGKLSTDQTPPEFVEEREFSIPHDILQYVDKDDPLGPPPQNPFSDPQYALWESGVRSWVDRTKWNTTSTAPTEYDDVHTRSSQPIVTIPGWNDNQQIASRSFTIPVNVQAQRRIVRVEAMINNQPIGSTAQDPWTITANLPWNLAKGFYELNVTAIDDVGNRGNTKLNLNIQAEPVSQSEIGNLNIVSPFNDVVWSRSAFPQTIEIGMSQPMLYQLIDISFVGDDGVSRLVHSQPNPTDTTLRVSVPAGPPVGRYRLLVTGTRQDGTKEDDSIFVSVTE